MQVEFGGKIMEFEVYCFDDLNIKYQVWFLHYDKTPEITKRKFIVFKVVDGVLLTYKTGIEREDTLLSKLAFTLKAEFPHDIKRVLLSTTTVDHRDHFRDIKSF
jgi:hypothetical protein